MGNSNKKGPIIPSDNEWINLIDEEHYHNAIKEYNEIIEEKAKTQLFDIFNEINTKEILNKFKFHYITFDQYYKDNKDYILNKLRKYNDIHLKNIVLVHHMDVKIEDNSVSIPLLGDGHTQQVEQKYLFYVNLSLKSSEISCTFTKYQKISFVIHEISTEEKIRNYFLKCYKAYNRTDPNISSIIIDTKSRIFKNKKNKNGFLLAINGYNVKDYRIQDLKKIVNIDTNTFRLLSLIIYK